MQRVTAIYENGVLKPTEPLDLPAHAEVRLTIEPLQKSPLVQSEIEARLAALSRIGSYDNRVQAGVPPLSDEDISRDSVYEGRGR